jgi:hypothetical protein
MRRHQSSSAHLGRDGLFDRRERRNKVWWHAKIVRHVSDNTRRVRRRTRRRRIESPRSIQRESRRCRSSSGSPRHPINRRPLPPQLKPRRPSFREPSGSNLPTTPHNDRLRRVGPLHRREARRLQRLSLSMPLSVLLGYGRHPCAIVILNRDVRADGGLREPVDDLEDRIRVVAVCVDFGDTSSSGTRSGGFFYRSSPRGP